MLDRFSSQSHVLILDGSAHQLDPSDPYVAVDSLVVQRERPCSASLVTVWCSSSVIEIADARAAPTCSYRSIVIMTTLPEKLRPCCSNWCLLKGGSFLRLRKFFVLRESHVSAFIKVMYRKLVGEPYLLSSMSMVSIVYSLFQPTRQGNFDGSTLPLLWSTHGRLTLETNWIVGGESG